MLTGCRRISKLQLESQDQPQRGLWPQPKAQAGATGMSLMQVGTPYSRLRHRPPGACEEVDDSIHTIRQSPLLPGPARWPPNPPALRGPCLSNGLSAWRTVGGFGIRLAWPLANAHPRPPLAAAPVNTACSKTDWAGRPSGCNLGGTWTSGGLRSVLEQFLIWMPL